ncbi:hypothetical protein PDESU_05236 [Pontiella desulfatans]|uniref:Uncharacterized protein n=1 Tax=Pontiella desulfatans TaxID=2750659 RepID=A0A6C2U9I2_PONDE|nr:hypothetical protein [Pontiella desulfatans]VGO16645.1 hypothetical protein PDESU_05236 [Pontiella desulfatans]
MKMKLSARKSESQSPAVKYRGYWFWIDDADLKTKTEFRLVRTLWSISIAGAADHMSAPILILPVGN